MVTVRFAEKLNPINIGRREGGADAASMKERRELCRASIQTRITLHSLAAVLRFLHAAPAVFGNDI
jgi:hypothetical protein